MATKALTEYALWRAVKLRAQHSTTAAAARASGMHRCTLTHRLLEAERRGITADWGNDADIWEVTKTGRIIADLSGLDDDLPDYEEVKKRLAGHNQGHIDKVTSSRHIHLKVPHDVFLQFFIGDLHRDSPGHDDDQFEADMGAIRRAQEEFTCHVVNMGDILDNWPTGGRLAGKHHDSHLTRTEALALIKGFMQGEGLEFVLHILGNHDAWPGVDFATLLKQWTPAPVVDWAAYIHVITDKGWKFDAFAAHDMTGSSIRNPVHALARRAQEEGLCDLYVAAHRHRSGQGKDQNGFRARTYNLMRVRGYKRADEYAWRKGYPDEEEGATGLAVINPHSKTQDGRCRTFYDLEEGLMWARAIRAANNG